MINEEDIFATAAALSADEQAAWLDSACAGQSEARARIEALLRSDAASGFMDAPAGIAAGVEFFPESDSSPAEQSGARIGRYRLLQQIGEGGFGVVWMAEQVEPVIRRVALKIIKAGMDTKEVIARFEAERQALAMMDHPNIARVLDAGATDQGRPFFAMELVKGIPITRFCDERESDLRDRLALFGDVCSAINHAHQKGVIHRDIKPSNVMVTLNGDRPVVKVIDFGIAKATQGRLTDKTLYTRFEQFVGTPAYMSPEQTVITDVDIDTRADIYALGVLLYELITGQPPFEARSLLSAGYEEMRRMIREVEPVRPSARLSLIAGEERATLAKARQTVPEKLGRMVEPDLDWIVMKAIEKDRTHRYETANGLALDIQRFLADEPVNAGPPSAAYRFRKFARRHKTALRSVTALAAVLVAGSVVSVWQAMRATKAESFAKAKTEDEKVAREDAQAVSAFLTDIFQSPDPERDGRTITVAEMLDRAAEKLGTEFTTGHPARRARLQAALGATYHSLGLSSQAIPLQEKSRDYFLAASGPEHADTLAAMISLAESYDSVDRWKEALDLREGALPLSRRVFGPQHKNTLRAMTSLAVSYDRAGHRTAALKLREATLPLCREALGPEHPDTLRAMANLIFSLRDASRLSEASRLRGELLALREKALRKSVSKNGWESTETVRTMVRLAGSYRDAGRVDDAATMLRKALPLSSKTFGPRHSETIGTMAQLADTYRLGKQHAEAIPLLQMVCEHYRTNFDLEHAYTVRAMYHLGRCYCDAGLADEGICMLEQVLRHSLGQQKPDHPLTLKAVKHLARAYGAAHRWSEAVETWEQFLALNAKQDAQEHRETLLARYDLALALKQLGRLPDALEQARQSSEGLRKLLGDGDPHTWLSRLLYQTLATDLEEWSRQDMGQNGQ